MENFLVDTRRPGEQAGKQQVDFYPQTDMKMKIAFFAILIQSGPHILSSERPKYGIP